MEMQVTLFGHQPVAGQFLADLRGELQEDRRPVANDKTRVTAVCHLMRRG
jgi:hypothetical protein